MGAGRVTWFWSRFDERGVDGARLVDPRFARAAPQHGVVVLVQRFFLLDTDRLRGDGLWWLGKVFLEAFVALAVYLVTDRLPYLHQGASKV